MTDLPTLKALQTRIRNATGADRELDADIFAALFPETSVRLIGMPDSDPDIRMFEYGHSTGTALRVTGSLDACVQLMHEVLPGWTRAVDASAPEAGIDVELFSPEGLPVPIVRDTHDLETHATLLAIIAAKIAHLEARVEYAHPIPHQGPGEG